MSRENSFRLNIVPISPVQKLKGQFGNLYVIIAPPTTEQNDSFVRSYFKQVDVMNCLWELLVPTSLYFLLKTPFHGTMLDLWEGCLDGIPESGSKFGSGMFLLVQVVLLLDFVHGWNDAWVKKDEQFCLVIKLTASRTATGIDVTPFTPDVPSKTASDVPPSIQSVLTRGHFASCGEVASVSLPKDYEFDALNGAREIQDSETWKIALRYQIKQHSAAAAMRLHTTSSTESYLVQSGSRNDFGVGGHGEAFVDEEALFDMPMLLEDMALGMLLSPPRNNLFLSEDCVEILDGGSLWNYS
ncbi:hypothetical protein IFM89_027374 [Coptis chinensis]|uniref:Uncharacterized protein n=1 Tax=Coptis chinensis TaxID=261450 RepID=A0A835M0W5_9MAGN|nr:hypothetical protein IFM89_027374 [Coptis chinensis]